MRSRQNRGCSLIHPGRVPWVPPWRTAESSEGFFALFDALCRLARAPAGLVRLPCFAFAGFCCDSREEGASGRIGLHGGKRTFLLRAASPIALRQLGICDNISRFSIVHFLYRSVGYFRSQAP